MKLPSTHYQWIQTADGSHTLHSDLYGEACHSTSGAKAETLLHYLEGCQVKERLLHYPCFHILEVGLGLGLGFLTTLETLENNHPWHFVTMEIDPDLVSWFLEEHQHLDIIKTCRKISPQLIYGQVGMIELSIIIGDARLTVPAFLREKPLKFHAIFQDAFSPKRNPHLWTVEWFRFLRQYAHPECILSTYSASSSIRKSLIESHWKVRKGHQFGPKRSSTRAYLQGENDPEIILHLERSPVSPLYDEGIEEFRQNQKKDSI